MKIFVSDGSLPTEKHPMLAKVYEAPAFSSPTIRKWAVEFKLGCLFLGYDPRKGPYLELFGTFGQANELMFIPIH